MTYVRAINPNACLLLADGKRLLLTEDGMTVESDVERIRVATAYKPNTRWRLVDTNGHLHVYVKDEENVPRLPSLERRVRTEPCDGACGDSGCEGIPVTEWCCRECGELVEPGFVRDYAAEENGIPVSQRSEYTVTVRMEATDPQPARVLEGASYAQGEHKFPLPPLQLGEYKRTPIGFGDTEVRATYHGSQIRNVEVKPTGP